MKSFSFGINNLKLVLNIVLCTKKISKHVNHFVGLKSLREPVEIFCHLLPDLGSIMLSAARNNIEQFDCNSNIQEQNGELKCWDSINFPFSSLKCSQIKPFFSSSRGQVAQIHTWKALVMVRNNHETAKPNFSSRQIN